MTNPQPPEADAGPPRALTTAAPIRRDDEGFRRALFERLAALTAETIAMRQEATALRRAADETHARLADILGELQRATREPRP
jgi:hypothetical protein